MNSLPDVLLHGGVISAPPARVGLLREVVAQWLSGGNLAAELEALAEGGEVSTLRVGEVVDVDVRVDEGIGALEA